MKKRTAIQWVLFALGLSVHGAVIDFRHNGTGTNGFYFWNDPVNWHTGSLPTSIDAARFRYPGESKAHLSSDVTVNTLSIIGGNTAAQIAGAETVFCTYFSFLTGADRAMEISGSVSVQVSNRIRFYTGSSSLVLKDDARVGGKIGFDEANAQFTVTLNGNSVFENFVAPVAGEVGNIGSGSKFVLNDSSSLVASSRTAANIHTDWLAYGVVFELNDTAFMTFSTHAANAANLATYISEGKILINGSSNAVSGIDYTYDANSGVLRAGVIRPGYATDGLVLYLNAADPGPDPFTTWRPAAGGPQDELAGYLHGFGQMHRPYLKSEAVSAGHLWHYRIDADSTGGGQIGGLGRDVLFDYDQSFTIEAWIRAEVCPEPVNGRGTVFSDKSGTTGYRFGVRNDASGGYYMEMVMRDSTGPVQTVFRGIGAQGSVFGTWHHVMVTYQGRTGDGPVMTFYKDGALSGSYTGTYEDPGNPDFIPSFESAAIGAKTFGTGGYNFNGDIAKVRVYNRVLSGEEVQQNYTDSLPVREDPAPVYPGPETTVQPPVENLDQTYPVYAQGPHRERMKVLPVSRRQTVFIDPNIYFCRVDVCKTPSGKLVCTFLEANDHVGSLFSNVAVSESLDNGKTWSPYRVIMEGSFDIPRIQSLSDGRLVITTRNGPINWSADEGMTWTQGSYPEGSDKMRELSNGDWVLPAQRFRSAGSPNEEIEEVLRRSFDNGNTWWPIPDIVQSAYRKFFNEGTIWELPTGRLAAYCREDNYRYYPMFLNFSEDFGRTWTSPQMSPLFGHRPAGDNLKSGKTLLTYRQIGGDVGYVAWLGHPEQDRNVFPIVARDIEGRITLQSDRLVMVSANGNNAATMYTLPPTSTPSDRIVMETEMRVLTAGADGCVICPGVVFNIDPSAGRVYLREDSSIGFSADVTQFHTYRFDRTGSALKVWCDGVLKIDQDISHVMALMDPTVPLDRPSMYVRAENGRNVLFGNWPYYRWSTTFYANNAAHSEWKSMKVDVYAQEFPGYHWQWSATDAVYPDQYLRNRQIMLETEGSYKQSDCGYGSWVQLDDGSILVMNYTRGDGQDMPVQDKPFIRSYLLYEEDFLIPADGESLYLNANAPGRSPETNWEPVTGSGGTLFNIGTAAKPDLQAESSRSFYHFDSALQGGGGVQGFGSGLNFDYDSRFTIETWIRPQQSRGTAGRMNVFGNQLESGSGYRLTAREATGGRFYIEFEMRDNIGPDPEKAKYEVRSKGVADMNTWTYVAAVFDGASGQIPEMNIYINSIPQELNDYRDTWVPTAGTRDFVTAGQYAVVGMRGADVNINSDDVKYWFGGDIAMIRVSGKVLTAEEVTESYKASLTVLPFARPQIAQSVSGLNGRFRLSGSGMAGQPYRVLASTNLTQSSGGWILIGTGTFAGGVFEFIDSQSTNYPQRYYRLDMP